jgi:PhnB protein
VSGQCAGERQDSEDVSGGAVSKNPTFTAAAVPYLMVRGAADAIEFYKRAFGAEEKMRFPMPNGKVGHAEVRIEGAPVYLADEGPGAGMQSPAQLGGTTVTVSIYVADVDAFAKKAQAGGAVVLRPLADQFYGERSVSLRDPFGHTWHFATVTEELTIEEMQKRMPR